MNRLDIQINDQGVAQVRLNRPDVRNAFDEQMIAELAQAFTDLSDDNRVRVVVLRGEGKQFSAGADLNWMKRAAEADEATNGLEALKMAEMFFAIDTCAKPVIGLVQGAAFGGGVGLVAVCDVVVATPDAQFCLSEVRLGLIPAVISPFVLQKTGVAASRRYMLTAERFAAVEALRIGLVQEISDTPEAVVDALIAAFLAGAPEAIADAKALIRDINGLGTGADVLELNARRIARRRATAEAKEGIAAFLEKRTPNWVRS